MNRAGRAFLEVLGYFTTLPAFGAVRGPAPDAYALSFLPGAGAVVGAISGFAAWGASYVLPHGLTVAIAFALTLLLTGAIHVDGFLDSCDALFASVPVQRRLEIMKDPRHGTFAVACMAVLTVAWVAALWPFDAQLYPLLLTFSGMAGRMSAAALAFNFPYARGGEISRQLDGKPSAFVLLACAVIAAALAYAIVPWGPVVLAGAFVLARLIGTGCARALGGGLTGDAYGFTIVIVEVSVLAAFTAHRP